MTRRAAAEALLQTYLAACEARDVAAIASCFAPHAVVMDPTSPRARGRRRIGAYFHALYDDLADLRLSASSLYWQGEAAACHWRGHATRRDGGVIDYEGIDVFDLNAAPLIRRMRAFWDPKDFM